MNPDVEKLVEEAREHLDAEWTDERARVALGRVKRGYARRRTAKAVAAVAAVVALCALPFLVGHLQPETVPFHDTIEVSANAIDLAEDVRITPLEERSQVAVSGVSDERVELQLDDGLAHFDIESAPGRTYVITAGVVEIEVVGTSFDVARRSKEVVVSVHEGTVAVRSEELGEAFLLNAGESRSVSLEADASEVAEAEPVPAEASDEVVEPEPEIIEAPEPVAPKPKRWREMTKRKEWKEASKVILEDPEVVDRRVVGELFDAADAMRRSGYHDIAAQYLGVIADEHTSDRRASMAAHTRGRILSRRLGEHCQAADAFAQAQSIGLDGMLQRDALANEAESLIACGNAAAAAKRIERYRREYPSGPHLATLEKLAGQDEAEVD